MVTDSVNSHPLRPGLALRRTDLAGAAIVYDDPPDRLAPQLQARDLEVMRALSRYAFLTTSQISETWWAGRHPSRSQVRLTELTGAGLIERFRPVVKRGSHQWIYQLTRAGFRAVQEHAEDSEGDAEGRWNERRVTDMSTVVQALRVNGWMLAYDAALGDRLLDWRGAREARRLAPEVASDAALLINAGPESGTLELLVEFARDERSVLLEKRLQRYDDLLADSWRSVPSFAEVDTPPAAAFVATGYRDVERLLRSADAAIGEVARSRLIFCAEPDLHRGSWRAWMLPARTPEQRGSTTFTATEIALPGYSPA